MPVNLENSAVATGLEKVSFLSNLKERQCQRMLKLPHNCTHLSSVQFNCSVVSDSPRPHESQHARPPCPSPSPGVHSNSCPSSRWCHPAILHASKVMLKILQTRLQQYVNRELPDVQAGFRKGRGTRDQIANIQWIIEKAGEFQKNMFYWLRQSLCVNHNKLENVRLHSNPKERKCRRMLKLLHNCTHLTC